MKTRPVVVAVLASIVLTGCVVPITRDVPSPPAPHPAISDAVPTPLPTVVPSALPVLAARETSHEGTPLDVAVNSLHTTAGSTTLNFTITNRGGKPWKHWDAMSGGFEGRDNMTIKRVFLLDTKNGRRLLPAQDSEGGCVCSKLGGEEISPEQSMVFSAVFAPLPAGVGTAAVHIPLAGTFDEVPVSR